MMRWTLSPRTLASRAMPFRAALWGAGHVLDLGGTSARRIAADSSDGAAEDARAIREDWLAAFGHAGRYAPRP
jgi:hypothetical protein